jgi:hypothetical protein
MASVIAALRHVKGDLPRILEAQNIQRHCAELGYTWRAGPLDPVNTVALFVQQVIAGNIACTAVRHQARQAFTGSAYCQARQRLPLELLHRLSQEVGLQAARSLAVDPQARWKGHRLWAMDGSSFSMPDTPQLQAHFGQPKGQRPGCGFPVAHLLALLDLHTGMLAEPVAAPLYTSDLHDVSAMHAQMQEGDLLLGDDFFSNYGHVALLQRQNLHFLGPNHHRRLVSFKTRRGHTKPRGGQRIRPGQPRSRWIRRLGWNDQLVEWFKPVERPAWMSAQLWESLPASMVVREIRRQVKRKGWPTITVTLITTLLDARKYPAQELVELYLRRWEVETAFKYLKTTLGMEVLKCQSVLGVQKELAVFVLLYNLVRRVMLEAARRQGVAPQRISFADTLAWLRHAGPDEPLPVLLIVPQRPGRLEPRVRKRRPKNYPLMKQPRATLRQALQNPRKAA